jgi:rhodanese-related sulfurtransferase
MLVLSLVLSGIILARNFIPVSSTAGTSHPYVPTVFPGMRLILPGVEFRGSTGTIVFALTAPCLDCSPAMASYRRLVNVAKEHRVAIVLVTDKIDWVRSQGFATDGITVLNERGDRFGIGLNPGVLWISDDGVLIQQWMGNIDQIEFSQVEAKLLKLQSVPAQLNGEFSDALLRRISDTEGLVFLDIRERVDFARFAHRAEALNIPLDELDIRARHELDETAPTIIDCSVVGPGVCDYAKILLEAQGFRSVSLLNRGMVPVAGCALPPKKNAASRESEKSH